MGSRDWASYIATMSETAPDQYSILEQQLRVHPFTKGLSPEDAPELARHAELVSFESRDVIFDAGAPADRFYLIRTGVVSLEVTTATGAIRSIQTITEGSVLGWSWLFPPYRWEFRAVAETPVRAIAIGGEALRTTCEVNPALGYRLVRRIAEAMADRLHATRRRLSDL